MVIHKLKVLFLEELSSAAKVELSVTSQLLLDELLHQQGWYQKVNFPQ